MHTGETKSLKQSLRIVEEQREALWSEWLRWEVKEAKEKPRARPHSPMSNKYDFRSYSERDGKRERVPCWNLHFMKVNLADL